MTKGVWGIIPKTGLGWQAQYIIVKPVAPKTLMPFDERLYVFYVNYVGYIMHIMLIIL